MILIKNKYKILVVEDNPGDFLLISDHLTETIEKVEIEHTESFKQTADLLSHSTFDVILLDLTLPDSFGEKLITDMMALVRHTPIIILTGYSDMQFSISSIALGISDYLIKDELTSNALYKSIIYSIERVRTNLLLKISEKKFSNLFYYSPKPMWAYDIETLAILQVNNAAMQHYGYSAEEFSELTILDIESQDDILQSSGALLEKKKMTPILLVEHLNICTNPVKLLMSKSTAHQ